MKARVALFMLAAALLLPAVTSLFDLEARRGGGTVISGPDDDQTQISPN